MVSAPTPAVSTRRTIWVELNPSASEPSSQIEASATAGNGEPDARDRGPVGQVEARLEAAATGVAEGRERLREQYEQGDHDADCRLRRFDPGTHHSA
jgi:hypothetical protein